MRYLANPQFMKTSEVHKRLMHRLMSPNVYRLRKLGLLSLRRLSLSQNVTVGALSVAPKEAGVSLQMQGTNTFDSSVQVTALFSLYQLPLSYLLKFTPSG